MLFLVPERISVELKKEFLRSNRRLINSNGSLGFGFVAAPAWQKSSPPGGGTIQNIPGKYLFCGMFWIVQPPSGNSETYNFPNHLQWPSNCVQTHISDNCGKWSLILLFKPTYFDFTRRSNVLPYKVLYNYVSAILSLTNLFSMTNSSLGCLWSNDTEVSSSLVSIICARFSLSDTWWSWCLKFFSGILLI